MLIGSNILFHKNLTSTNTLALRLLSEGKVQEGTVVRTNFQTAGRGQPGSSWESEKDKNLLFSIILYPSMVPLKEQFLISMALSLGIHGFVSSHAEGCSIKWPNDIYVNDDKIAGILIENSVMEDRITFSVAGIGININQEIFTGGAPNPVSLKNLSGKTYDLEVCMADLCAVLDKWYGKLRSGESQKIREEYKSRLYRFGHWHKYLDSKGKFAGRITDVGDDGRLEVEKSNGSKKYYYLREIDFIS